VTDPAAKAGIQEGDKILTVDGQRVITPGDFNWILNGFKSGALKIGYERDGKKATATIDLKGFEWRKTDITWRDSWWDNGANMGIVGEDLSVDEKKQMKIAADDLAFKIVRLFPKGSAQPAGLLVDDIITGVDGKSDAMGEIEFQMHMRLAHRIGDMVPIIYYRKGQKMTMQVKIK
jgi:S1-C subfamily serine protease